MASSGYNPLGSSESYIIDVDAWLQLCISSGNSIVARYLSRTPIVLSDMKRHALIINLADPSYAVYPLVKGVYALTLEHGTIDSMISARINCFTPVGDACIPYQFECTY
jgi:hypothetical protein